jgi:hypothetical protein
MSDIKAIMEAREYGERGYVYADDLLCRDCAFTVAEEDKRNGFELAGPVVAPACYYEEDGHGTGDCISCDADLRAEVLPGLGMDWLREAMEEGLGGGIFRAPSAGSYVVNGESINRLPSRDVYAITNADGELIAWATETGVADGITLVDQDHQPITPEELWGMISY